MNGDFIDSPTKLILMTGATGFIGRHLLPALHKQNLQLILAIRRHPINELSHNHKIINVGEINETINWLDKLKRVDTVIHLAARAHQLNDQSINPEAEFLRINCEGTKNLAKQAIAAGVKHFIFISSIGAMATLSDTIISEESPCQPDTPYGRSKLNAETALVELCQKTQMNWTILRPTLVYGPNNPGNNSNRNNKTCSFCRRMGHRQEECRQRMNANQPCIDANGNTFWPKINTTDAGAPIQSLQDQDFQF